MKKFNYFFLLLFTLQFTLTMYAQDFRKYAKKSGHVEYKLSGDATGTNIVYWDDWGRKEIQIQDSKTTVWGMTNEENKTTLMLGTVIYTWKKGDNEIQKSENPMAKIWKDKNYTEKDIDKFSKQTLETGGFKKTGEEIVDGKICEVYEGLGGKLWIWKNNQVAIKTNIKLLGINIISEATKIDLNANVPASVFELPKDMEIVEVKNNNQQANEPQDVQSALKNLLKGNSESSNKNVTATKNDSSKKSDENFTDEVVKETKDAAVEGAKEGVKETAKETAKEEAKKATKKTIKKLFKSIF